MTRKRLLIGIAGLALVAAVIVGIVVLLPRPVFVAGSLSAPEAVLSGERIVVEVELANEGRAAGETDLTVLVDGEPAQARSVALEAGDEGSFDVVVAGLPAGTYELTLEGWSDLTAMVWVFDPPRLEVADAIVGGEDVVAHVRVVNEGRHPVEQTLTLLLAGSPEQSVTAGVAAGAEATFGFTLRGLDPGRYQLRAQLAGWTGRAESVWVMRPAEFTVDRLTVSPSVIDINTSTEATVLVTVSNTGEVGGSHLLCLEFDGRVVAERSVSIEAGASIEESFQITVDTPGAHAVVVGDSAAAFNAHQISRPGNGTVLTNTIGGGANRLRIVNNRDEDAVVVLAHPGDGQPALLAVYVRGGSSHTVRGIRDGTYTTYFTRGYDWCLFGKEFTREVLHDRFRGDGEFVSTRRTYTQYTVTFGITGGEGTPSEQVDPEDFPKM